MIVMTHTRRFNKFPLKSIFPYFLLSKKLINQEFWSYLLVKYRANFPHFYQAKQKQANQLLQLMILHKMMINSWQNPDDNCYCCIYIKYFFVADPDSEISYIRVIFWQPNILFSYLIYFVYVYTKFESDWYTHMTMTINIYVVCHTTCLGRDLRLFVTNVLLQHHFILSVCLFFLSSHSRARVCSLHCQYLYRCSGNNVHMPG